MITPARQALCRVGCHQLSLFSLPFLQTQTVLAKSRLKRSSKPQSVEPTGAPSHHCSRPCSRWRRSPADTSYLPAHDGTDDRNPLAEDHHDCGRHASARDDSALAPSCISAVWIACPLLLRPTESSQRSQQRKNSKAPAIVRRRHALARSVVPSLVCD